MNLDNISTMTKQALVVLAGVLAFLACMVFLTGAASSPYFSFNRYKIENSSGGQHYFTGSSPKMAIGTDSASAAFHVSGSINATGNLTAAYLFGDGSHITGISVPTVGSIATQAATNVALTGGIITGITDLAVADGGTGASTAGTARSNLGIGSIATQNSTNVAITGGTISGATISGGSINNTSIGLSAQSASSFLSVTSPLNLEGSPFMKIQTDGSNGWLNIDGGPLYDKPHIFISNKSGIAPRITLKAAVSDYVSIGSTYGTTSVFLKTGLSLAGGAYFLYCKTVSSGVYCSINGNNPQSPLDVDWVNLGAQVSVPPIQASTPQGALAYSFVSGLCVFNGSTWLKVTDYSSTCTW